MTQNKPLASCLAHRVVGCPALKCDNLEARSHQIFYAVAFEYSDKPGVWKAGNFEYMHAPDIGEARLTFFAGQPMARRIRIVDIAPVLGYHVLDNHGDKLSV